MLLELGLENFKPFGTPQRIELAPITLVYGPNSGGKSSLLQSLMLLRQTIEGHGAFSAGLIPRGQYVDLGSFKSLLHRHEVERDFLFHLRFSAEGASPDRQIQLSTRFRAVASESGDSSRLEEVRYRIDQGRTLDLRLARHDRGSRSGLRTPSVLQEFAFADVESRNSYARYVLQHNADNRQRKGEARPTELISKCQPVLQNILDQASVLAVGLLPSRISFPPGLGNQDTHGLHEIYSALDELVGEIYDVTSRLSYMGPLRTYPARHYLVTGGEKTTVGTRGEFAPELLYRRRDQLMGTMNRWFERFEIPYTLEIRAVGDEVTGEIIALRLKDRRTGVGVAPSDVGFGIGQLLPIIVEGMVAEGRVLCVEQPEIHLHPRLQAHVADLMIETTGLLPLEQRGDEAPKNQWLAETHSEALMLRLQRRIRQGRISPDDVAVIYVDPVPQRGSEILRLRLDEDGEFVDEWPHGFFEEGYDELFGESA